VAARIRPWTRSGEKEAVASLRKDSIRFVASLRTSSVDVVSSEDDEVGSIGVDRDCSSCGESGGEEEDGVLELALID